MPKEPDPLANADPNPAQNPDGPGHPIKLLMAAVIQVQDLDNAIKALSDRGITAKALASTGGFLGRKNVTLLIGLAEDQREQAVLALSKGCRRRVEYLVTPLEGSPFSLPLSTPVSVGGATIFTLAVERFEEF